MTKKTYLDYAAATPVAKEVMIAMHPYFSDFYFNPSALYTPAREVRRAIEEARSSIARDIGARAGEIIFTAGGTEADNLAIHGVMARFPTKKLLISAIEHEAVREPARKYNYSEIPVSAKGEIIHTKFREMIDDDTVLVSVMLANNEVGTVQPIKEVVEHVAQIRKDRQKRGILLPLYVHTDACQAVSHLDIHVSRLGIDLMTINGGKIYGPKQSGALYVRAGVGITPIIEGGGQENAMRSGTENVPAIIGLASALSLTRRKAISEKKRLEILRDEWIRGVTTKIPDIIIHGHPKRRLPHMVSFAVPGIDNERLMMMCDEAGFMVATGSACSASNQESSHVLKAMGIDDAVAQSTLRISFGRTTTKKDLFAFLDCLVEQISAIKQLF